MRGRRLAALAVACLLFPAVGHGAEVSGGSDGDLKLSWTVEPQTRDYTAVCGNVFNQRRMSGRNIRIRVEGSTAAIGCSTRGTLLPPATSSPSAVSRSASPCR